MDQIKSGIVQVKPVCPLLNPSYRLLDPWVKVQGVDTKMLWGVPHELTLSAGEQTIVCYLKNWFGKQLWQAESRVVVADGQTVVLQYTLPATLFGQIASHGRGRILVADTVGQIPADPPVVAVPAMPPGFCVNCGGELGAKAKFCGGCGTAVRS